MTNEKEDNIKLLKEWTPFQYTLLKEGKDSSGKDVLFLEGILQRAETLNQNGRIYPKNVLEREVRNYQKLIRERRALGALDHTDNTIIELKTVSHLVVDAHMDGDGVVRGKIEILNTANGKELKALVEQNITIGISSRGVGSTKTSHDGYQVVQDDFQLICWDCVSEPSTPGSFMHLSESRILTREELSEFRKNFGKSDRIDRIANDILTWK